MARKKRKAVKAPPSVSRSVPLAEAVGLSAWGLPALGALVLVLSWLALLGGFSDGTTDIRSILHLDSLAPRMMFRDLFQLRGDGALVVFPTAPHHFPDNLTQWTMMALGASATFALLLTPLLQAAFSAAGWVLTCDALFGKSPARRCAVLLLHALPLLTVAWRGADLFWSQINPHSHFGPYTMIPWMLWLSVRVLEGGARTGGKTRNAPPPVGFAFGLVLLLAAGSASDLLLLPWFVGPAGGTAFVLAWLGRLEWRRALWLFGLLAAGCVVGRLLSNVLPSALGAFQISLPTGDERGGGLAEAAANLAAHMGHALTRNPMEGLAWLAFVFVAVWRAAALLNPSLRKKTPSALDVPEGFGHSLAAVYAPAAIAGGLGGVFIGLDPGGAYYLVPNPDPYISMAFSIRYFMPAWFIPLFVGWALLPGPRATLAAALAACALAGALAAPKVARMDSAALNLFNSPFYQCFAENAKRLNWRAGISTPSFQTVAEVPGVENRVLPVGVFRRPGAGQSFMVVDIAFTLKPVNEYQFVVANSREGRAFYYPPLAGETGCAVNEPGACWFLPDGANRVLSPADARAAFGEPKEEINCAGVGLLHYDPPLRFDFTGKTEATPTPAYLTPVARW